MRTSAGRPAAPGRGTARGRSGARSLSLAGVRSGGHGRPLAMGRHRTHEAAELLAALAPFVEAMQAASMKAHLIPGGILPPNTLARCRCRGDSGAVRADQGPVLCQRLRTRLRISSRSQYMTPHPPPLATRSRESKGKAWTH